MRNWFHRWLSRPWISQYDVLCVSSSYGKLFFDLAAAVAPLFVPCSERCPPLFPLTDAASGGAGADVAGTGAGAGAGGAGDSAGLKSRVELLRLATNQGNAGKAVGNDTVLLHNRSRFVT